MCLVTPRSLQGLSFRGIFLHFGPGRGAKWRSLILKRPRPSKSNATEPSEVVSVGRRCAAPPICFDIEAGA